MLALLERETIKEPFDFTFLEMAWTKPEHSRGQVDRAGKTLATYNHSVMDISEALDILFNWRSSHSYPLHIFKKNLQNRAKKVDNNSVSAQRLKRLSSVLSKLQRNPNMKLSQMQDIGGCRAVMADVASVYELADIYAEGLSKNPNDRAELIETYDYIKHPKLDGYRSFHYVYKYRSKAESNKIFNGLRIEVQLRSRLQHAWATAVEVVSTFTDQALKSGVGNDDWKRFFALASSTFAYIEGYETVPDTPQDKPALIAELKELVKELNVEALLSNWSLAVQVIQDKFKKPDAHSFLLLLDVVAKTLEIKGYSKKEFPSASEQYQIVEQQISSKPETQAVLVSVDSISTLQNAFPNYYLDTKEFLASVKFALEGNI